MSDTALNPSWLQWPQTQRLIKAFAAQPKALRFVGGAVRDSALGRNVQDVDAATTLVPDATMALLETGGIRAIPTGISHGTITALVDGKQFEITTLRKDTYCDGRHAEVAFTDNWKEDAARRDFTMNALYLSSEGALFDYFGGLQDAKDGRVRFIGDPAQRIAEDYLRILRFFRFHAHYGIGTPDVQALQACGHFRDHLDGLSAERIQHELLRLFTAPVFSPALAAMQEQDILSCVLGFAVGDLAAFPRYEAIRQQPLSLDPVLALACFALLTDAPAETVEALATRLRLSRAAYRMLAMVEEHFPIVHSGMATAQQKQAIRHWGVGDFINAVVVKWALGHEAISASHPYAVMIRLAQEWHPPVFPLTGHDLIERGFSPGKALGERLLQLEALWEASDYQVTKDGLLAQL